VRVGREWAYTGTGNIVGGKIIEAISGEAMPRFYHKHLFGPLGCVDTDVTDTPRRRLQRAARHGESSARCY